MDCHQTINGNRSLRALYQYLQFCYFFARYDKQTMAAGGKKAASAVYCFHLHI